MHSFGPQGLAAQAAVPVGGQVPELGQGRAQAATAHSSGRDSAVPLPGAGMGMPAAPAPEAACPGRWALLPPAQLFILRETEEYFVSLTKQHFTSG